MKKQAILFLKKTAFFNKKIDFIKSSKQKCGGCNGCDGPEVSTITAKKIL